MCIEPYKLAITSGSELKCGYSFVIELNCLDYSYVCGVPYVNNSMYISAPLFDLPKEFSEDALEPSALKRVFVSQLSRISGISVELNSAMLEIILMSATPPARALTAYANQCNVWFGLGSNSKIECPKALLDLGISGEHIVRALFTSAVLLCYKQCWYCVKWQSSQLSVSILEYGVRRWLRPVMKRQPARARAILITPIVAHNGAIVLDAGLRFKSSFRLARLIKVAYDCTNVKAFLNIGRHCEVAAADSACKLASVDFSEAGRAVFNSITTQRCVSDTLSKRDLVFLWKRLVGANVHKLARDTNVRVIKSCGDTVLQRVLLELKCMFADNVDVAQPVEDTLLLGFKQIRFVVFKVFSASELCQYLEQLNSLTELCHKLRLTYMGEGGVTFRTASECLRDVQRWHFGHVCPIESPEGQNIGLVCSQALFSHVSLSGLMQTSLNKVYNGKLSTKFKQLDWFGIRNYVVLALGKKPKLRRSLCVVANAVTHLPSTQIELCYPSASQLFSPAVNLIPFLEYNDATRALMAANMQKQAVPLINPAAPLVGTGLESVVIRYADHNVPSASNALIVYSDAFKIVAYEYEFDSYRVYEVPMFWRTNQNSCFRNRAVVYPGQLVASGQHIVECQCSARSEIALGANLLVAFMVWNGLNYEDSIVLSESVVARGVFRSLHVLAYEVKLYKTPFGDEILTDVFSEGRCVTQDGVVRVGSVVHDGDVLVGKLAPTSARGEQTIYVDSSFRLPVGTGYATVVGIQHNKWDSKAPNLCVYVASYNAIKKAYAKRVLALLDCNNLIHYDSIECDVFCYVSDKLSVQCIINNLYNSYCIELSSLIKRYAAEIGDSIDNEVSSARAGLTKAIKIELLVEKRIQAGDKISGRHGNKGVISRVVSVADMPYMRDGTPIDIILNPLSVPSRMNLGQVLEARLGFISYKWGLEFKHVLETSNYASAGVIARARAKLSELYPNAEFNNCSDMAIMETIRKECLGVRFACHPFVKLDERHIELLFKRIGLEQNTSAQVSLYDGKTGKPFDRKVSVGSVYILKLNHMVDDKLHARSTGPYSIVTQQPLKGKSHNGGQRLGEMEVWALQAYGAAFLLKEALTVRSDDIEGRNSINDSILHNKITTHTTLNESFLVLIREMCSLCVNVELKARFQL
ncbi:hypothetical protein AADW59_00630 [Candidatus Hodgkinia cicadicola]